jgi:hypothetical protein
MEIGASADKLTRIEMPHWHHGPHGPMGEHGPMGGPDRGPDRGPGGRPGDMTVPPPK